MAPTAPTVVTIVPWPHFQGFIDAQPAIGGKLYTYVPTTSTPKASYRDAFFVTANPNPVVLDDQGAATVYLDGFYRLRLTDANEVLYWEVDNYTFATGAPPMPPGAMITGSTDATVSASPGASVIAIPGLVPLGYRVLGTTWTITNSFGTSGGLTGVMLGDRVAGDRWMLTTTLTAGTTGGQMTFHAGDEPIAALPYTFLLAALGGPFDASGDIHVTAYWQSLPADQVT